MRYCITCGSSLVQTVRLGHYDTMTGVPVYVFTRQCPERRWWRGYHTKVSMRAKTDDEAERSSDFQWHDFD